MKAAGPTGAGGQTTVAASDSEPDDSDADGVNLLSIFFFMPVDSDSSTWVTTPSRTPAKYAAHAAIARTSFSGMNHIKNRRPTHPLPPDAAPRGSLQMALPPPPPHSTSALGLEVEVRPPACHSQPRAVHQHRSGLLHR